MSEPLAPPLAVGSAASGEDADETYATQSALARLTLLDVFARAGASQSESVVPASWFPGRSYPGSFSRQGGPA